MAAGSLAAAAQHQHGHRHLHNNKREVVTVDGPTVVEYMLNGEVVTAEDVCQGITDGTLAWADGQPASDPCATSTSTTTTEAYTPTVAPAKFIETEASTSSSTSTTTSTTISIPTSTASSTTQAAATSSASSSSSSSSGVGLDKSFPDGEIDCGTFPSEYGAISLDYLDLGGWSGIQYVSFLGEVISDIVTAVTGDSCTSGAMCSYACPPGYQKSQWPATQGSTGQSVGGLQCKLGKLYLTNPDLSDKLCIEGVGGVKAENTLGQHVAVCRTDYPGTESETIPVSLNSGETKDLACPNGATYYKWEGKTTSAQYYVNPAGVSQEEGCQWGDGSKPVGNFAPINLGVGENNGKWLSIFQNSPTTTEKLDFNIKIVGDNLSGSCKYENGEFISDTGSNDSGCTVEVLSGDATFKMY
ncbi:SUN family protein UTH1 [Aspergillus stella-maris]|uniref:SUN family protein UTH1 n=1 Tax=Aspergillus stella-maris TaxID=1810926 RepID=UPI003CCE2DBD